MKVLIDHLEEVLSAMRWVIKAVLLLLAFIVSYVPIGVLAACWVYNAPNAFTLVWKSIERMETTPNKKRTPKKSRPWERLDDFDDVRARIRELSYPEH